MSVEAGVVLSQLEQFYGRVLPATGTLYILASGEMLLCESGMSWRDVPGLRLKDPRAAAVGRAVATFCPPYGGGPASHIVEATVRGIIAAATDDREARAWLTEIEEVEVRDSWFTARMTLKDLS